MKENKYYRFIGNKDCFTTNKIYKAINPNNLEAYCNFYSDKGSTNGYSGKNYKYFIEVTEEEYFAQEGFKIIKPNYNKLINILKFINENI